MKRLIIIIGIIILLNIVLYKKTFAFSRDGQPIIAYYFNYWGAPWGKTLDRGWGPWAVAGQNPESVIGPESWRRSIATGDRKTYPLIGPYDSSNPEVVRWQARNAKNAGIDAFAIMLWSYEFDKNDISGAKSSGYPTWGSQEWKVMKDVTIPVIAQEGFHFILGDEMVEADTINCDYKNGKCPLTFGGDSNNEQEQHNRCNNPATPCFSLNEMPSEVRQKLQENNNYLTHKRYADLVLNAYAGLTLAAPPYPYWNAYLRTGNRTNGLPNLPGMPYYYIPRIERYRESPTTSFTNSDMGHKLKRSLEVVEELIGGQVAWFGYDGNVTWSNDPNCSPAPSCADFWSPSQFGKIYALVDGFGFSRSFIYGDAPGQPGSGESTSQNTINDVSSKVSSSQIGFAPNIQTSFDDTILGLGRGAGDILNAQTNPAIRRNNGETFRRSIRVYKNTPVKPDFYWLSSWNATYLEGYTVEPAITWGDDTDDPQDPYKYLKILASDLTGANFQPAPLPQTQSIDPLMWGPLGITPPTPTSSPTPALPKCPAFQNVPNYSCTFSGICTQGGGTCQSQYTCSQPGIIADCCCFLPSSTPIPPTATNIPPTPTVTSVPPTLIPGDLTGDNIVKYDDIDILKADFGNTGPPGFTPSDINKDGMVDIFDYNIQVENFGR